MDSKAVRQLITHCEKIFPKSANHIRRRKRGIMEKSAKLALMKSDRSMLMTCLSNPRNSMTQLPMAELKRHCQRATDSEQI